MFDIMVPDMFTCHIFRLNPGFFFSYTDVLFLNQG